MGMVFQSPNVFPVSVFHNIAIPLLTVAECPKSELADRVRKALEDVGLWKDVMERLHMPAEHLSGRAAATALSGPRSGSRTFHIAAG